jgi:hypothetical protein
LNKLSFNCHLSEFLSSRLGYVNKKLQTDIQLLHETQVHHPLASLFFPKSHIKYFNVLYIRQTKITTAQYSKNKKSDDSIIIFRHNNISTFGHVCSIFSVDDKQPLLLVDYLEQTKPLLYTITLSSSELYYDHIRHGNNATRKTCLININDFVEKSVYFSESQNTNYYFRFPTLCHSS